ncbi:hypothetical protein DO97_11200 [Neosynechococcus sphagnicola sy1]|uniref:Uncharacterized protein n=1 Tax=Neosynechococcus sphagnicola sy1 TaxID=1497020 RepID=A0A098TJC3_9CYAN|nr:hypothetical protein [Neosynechococcus sphagnicola]KGF72209.1 hypothetical protein DO97_11200 [Neosynechococcus sphagnicola sy1]
MEFKHFQTPIDTRFQTLIEDNSLGVKDSGFSSPAVLGAGLIKGDRCQKVSPDEVFKKFGINQLNALLDMALGESSPLWKPVPSFVTNVDKYNDVFVGKRN